MLMTIMNKSELRFLVEKADLGDKKAENELGLHYVDGLFDKEGRSLLKKNPTKAAYWFRRAAEHGDACAMLSLGNCLSDGLGVKKDEKAALSWLRKAYRNKEYSSANNIAVIYQQRKKHQRAFFWFVRASLKGDDDALFDVGLHYCLGRGVKKNYAKGVEYITRALESTDITEYGRQKSMLLMGVLCYNGFGVEQSVERARYWFEKARSVDQEEGVTNMLDKLDKREVIEVSLCKHIWMG